MGIRLGISVAGVVLGNQLIDADGTTFQLMTTSSEQAWGKILWLTLQGDLSLRILNLETLGNVWADLTYGIYLGGIVLGLVILQAVAANGLVLLAAWRAGKPSRY